MTGRHSYPRRTRRVGRTAISGAAALAMATAWPDVAWADGGGNANQYAVSIEADAMSGGVYNQTFPLTDYIGTSPYSAIAQLDSQGTSTAAAAAPYLGAFLTPLFATFNGVGPGLIPPFPRVPGYVQSSYPDTPSSMQSNGVYTIRAQSGTDRSSGLVDLGIAQDQVQGLLHAGANTIANHNGSVESVGEAGAEALNIGGVLTIGKVVSSLGLTQMGSKPPVISSATRVLGMEVNGMAVGLTEHGVTAMGNNTPLNAEDANRSARDGLRAAGIEVRYLPAKTVEDPATHFVQSVDSGALMVTVKHEFPGRGEYRLEMIFGRVSASTYNRASERPVETAATPSASDDGEIAETAHFRNLSPVDAPQPTEAELASVFATVPTTADAAVPEASVDAPIDAAGDTAPAAEGIATTSVATARSDQARLLAAQVSAMAPDDGTRKVFLTLLLPALAALGLGGAARWAAAR